MKPFTKFLQSPLSRLAEAFANILKPFQSLNAPTTIDARPGHSGNILTLVAHLCDMDDDMQQYVLRWLAYPLRNPGAKMSTALVFNGGQGSGKNLFFTCVAAALYGDNATNIRPGDLYSKFNYWTVGASLVIVDGDYALRHLECMKTYQTAESFEIALQGHASRTVKNRLNFVYLSNRDDFLPVDVGGRRFVVIEVPPARPRAFYDAIAYEIANGGIEGFRDYLMNRIDMGDFNQYSRPPMPAQMLPDNRRAA